MTDDLVTRLRTSADPSMVHEAADRIEELEARIFELSNITSKLAKTIKAILDETPNSNWKRYGDDVRAKLGEKNDR